MLVFGIIQIPIMLGFAVLLALLLDRSRGAFPKVCRTIYFMPYGIPIAIGALVWGYLYSANLSPFNQILAALHQNPIQFLSPALVLFSIGNIVTWTWTGYNMITLFAALQNIPSDLYEAARVDGATPWNIVRRIKLPLLTPTLTLLFIFSVIGTSQLFTEAFVLRPLGYLADNITPNFYLYLTAARDANYSYAGALAVLLAVLIFVISCPFLRSIGRAD
jgi:multiple sugar transport system permease protein